MTILIQEQYIKRYEYVRSQLRLIVLNEMG